MSETPKKEEIAWISQGPEEDERSGRDPRLRHLPCGLRGVPLKAEPLSHENTLNHRANNFFTPGVSLPRRQVSAAFLMTSPWVG
jgi:hypothetical protein